MFSTDMMAKNIIPLILVICLALTHGPVTASSANKNTNMAAGRTTIVELFEWRWVDIAKECETFLGPYGYGALQTSPPSENVVIEDPPRPWWEMYEPVSYNLENRDGTEEEYRDMVNRCNAVNVRVYSEIVFNHMTSSSGSGNGTGGSYWNGYAQSCALDTSSTN